MTFLWNSDFSGVIFNFKFFNFFFAFYSLYHYTKKRSIKRSKKCEVTFFVNLIFQVFFSRFKFLSFGSLGWSARLLLYTPTDPGSFGWSKSHSAFFVLLSLIYRFQLSTEKVSWKTGPKSYILCEGSW